MGMGWGWGCSQWGRVGDGEIFVGVGWGWGWCPLPCHSLIGKFGKILVTIHDTTDAMYTTIQCLQKRYPPVGEIIEEIQSRFNISLVVQCSSHSSASPLTASTSAFHVLSAQRRRIFTPRQILWLATNTKRGRIWQNPSTDRQRSLLILKSSNTRTSHDEMSIIHFHEKNFASYVGTIDSRRFSRQLRTTCRKDPVATTSQTRDIAVQSFRTVKQAGQLHTRWLLADWTMSLRGSCIYSVCLWGRVGGRGGAREGGEGWGDLALRANLGSDFKRP